MDFDQDEDSIIDFDQDEDSIMDVDQDEEYAWANKHYICLS